MAIEGNNWKDGQCEKEISPRHPKIGRNEAIDIAGSLESRRTFAMPKHEKERALLGHQKSFEDGLAMWVDMEALFE